MGIPAFFAYIAKNHTKIIKKLEYLNRVHNLLFDTQSIIYDIIRELENEKKVISEQLVYELICKKNFGIYNHPKAKIGSHCKW